MKENKDKNVEKLISVVMKDIPLESPSINFTTQVMATILTIEKNKVTLYKPLISRTGWVIIFGGFTAVIVYILTIGGTKSGEYAWWVGQGVRNFTNSFSGLYNFQFSQITITVIILSAILILAQIMLLKNHLDKRLNN